MQPECRHPHAIDGLRGAKRRQNLFQLAVIHRTVCRLRQVADDVIQFAEAVPVCARAILLSAGAMTTRHEHTAPHLSDRTTRRFSSDSTLAYAHALLLVEERAGDEER